LIFGEIANNEDCNATLIIDGDKKFIWLYLIFYYGLLF
jgi:hypothetical protein